MFDNPGPLNISVRGGGVPFTFLLTLTSSSSISLYMLLITSTITPNPKSLSCKSGKIPFRWLRFKRIDELWNGWLSYLRNTCTQFDSGVTVLFRLTKSHMMSKKLWGIEYQVWGAFFLMKLLFKHFVFFWGVQCLSQGKHSWFTNWKSQNPGKMGDSCVATLKPWSNQWKALRRWWFGNKSKLTFES